MHGTENKTYSRSAVFLVFLLAFFVRLYHLNIPFVEPYNNMTRQAVGAMIAKNFYSHGFRFLYPEIDMNGNGYSLFDAEMPVYAYLSAIAYWLAGGIKEWAARSVSVGFSMSTLVFMYLLVKRFVDGEIALYALIFLAFSPLSVALGRSIQPEALMLAGSAGAMYFFCVYQDSGKARDLGFSALWLWLAIASKVFAIFLFIPMIWLAWTRRGVKIFHDAGNYLFAILSCTALAWYAYAWILGRQHELIYVSLNYNRGPSFYAVWDLFRWHYLVKCSKVFFWHLLTAPGFVLCFVGFFHKKSSVKNFFILWFFALAFYTLIFWRIFIDHSYYQLPYLLPLSYFVAKGVVAAKHYLSQKGPLLKKSAIGLLAIVLIGNCAYLYRGLYFLNADAGRILHTGEAVQRLTRPEDLVIASDGRPPMIYYSHRKGWEFYYNEQTIEQFEQLRVKGASYFVSMDPIGLSSAIEFNHYLQSHYRLIETTSEYVIYDLK